jgi:peptide/nickel transport system substrate-binding protein
MRTRRWRAGAAIAACAAIALTACGGDDGDDGAAEGDGAGTFVFGVPNTPRSLDPVFASDGETFRVTRQVYDTLLDHQSGGNEIVGGLAETWDVSDDGLSWTFNLREGVKFHDGDDLDAAAVCANYERWMDFPEPMHDTTVAYYYNNLFGTFNNGESPTGNDYLEGCDADGLTVTINLKDVSANFPGAFSMATTAILSPSTLEQIDDSEFTSIDDGLPAYTQEVSGILAGTGPFKLKSWDRAQDELTVERFDDYWGENAGVEEIIFKAYADETALKQALEAGEIHGYDLVAPAHVTELEAAGFQVPTRDVFNILYLAFQQETNEELADLEVRQALAAAVDRESIVNHLLPAGGVVASQFMPDTAAGYTDDVTTYEYDPAAAEAVLDGMTLDFCWPTDVSRPYMPSPKDIFESIKADLEAVGVTVTETPMEWNDYIPAANGGDCELYLLGWTGDFNEGYNFLGTWFANFTDEFGMDRDDIFQKMAEANREGDPDARAALLSEASVMIMDELPGLPISSSPPSIVFSPDVNPPNVSPLTQEAFAEVSFK